MLGIPRGRFPPAVRPRSRVACCSRLGNRGPTGANRFPLTPNLSWILAWFNFCLGFLKKKHVWRLGFSQWFPFWFRFLMAPGYPGFMFKSVFLVSGFPVSLIWFWCLFAEFAFRSPVSSVETCRRPKDHCGSPAVLLSFLGGFNITFWLPICSRVSVWWDDV